MKRGVTGIAHWLCLLALSCDETSAQYAEAPRATLVQIDPEVFLNGVPCGPEPGALKTYVATLYDMTPSTGGVSSGAVEPVRLPSSPPASCRQSVVFGQPPAAASDLPIIVHNHAYAARIEAYARADLVQPEAGVPTLSDPESGEPVAPDWIADCGQTPLYEGPASEADALRVTAFHRETARFYACDPLVRTGPETPTLVAVELGAERCAEVGAERYVVRYEGEELEANCGEAIELPFVEPGEFVQVELLAYSSSSDRPTHGTTCNAKALLGARVSAQCDTLASEGSIIVDVQSVREALGDPSCTELFDILLTLEGPEPAGGSSLWLRREDCRGSARFAPVSQGERVIEASAAGAGSVICNATVEPGLSAFAVCGADEG